MKAALVQAGAALLCVAFIAAPFLVDLFEMTNA